MRVLSQGPLFVPIGHRAELLVFLINCVQKLLTVPDQALTRGSDTLFKNAGSALKLVSATASNSKPSPRKSVSTKLVMEPSVTLEELMVFWKSERTSWDVFPVGLSTKVLGSAYKAAIFTVCKSYNYYQLQDARMYTKPNSFTYLSSTEDLAGAPILLGWQRNL